MSFDFFIRFNGTLIVTWAEKATILGFLRAFAFEGLSAFEGLFSFSCVVFRTRRFFSVKTSRLRF